MNFFLCIFSVYVWASNVCFAYDQSDNDTRVTDQVKKAMFVFPPEDDILLLFQMISNENFILDVQFTHGSLGFGRQLEYNATPTHNWLIMHITKKWVSFTNKNDTWISEKLQTLQERRVNITSTKLMRCQMLVLPPEPNWSGFSESWPFLSPVTIIIILGVVCCILVVVLLASLAICHLKKNKTSRTQQEDPNTTEMSEFQSEIPDERNTPGDLRPELPRPGSSHDSENSIYGAVIR